MKLLTIALLSISFSAFSTTVNMAIDFNSSLINIQGDSNLKKWEVSAKKFSGSGSFEFEGGKLLTIKSFSVILDSKEIIGGRHSMDKKIAKTLEIENFPQIYGTIKNSRVKDNTVTGLIEFNLHGIKKVLNFSANISYSSGRLKVQGEQNLDMTEFGIKPPVTKILFITASVLPKLKINYKFELTPI